MQSFAAKPRAGVPAIRLCGCSAPHPCLRRHSSRSVQAQGLLRGLFGGGSPAEEAENAPLDSLPSDIDLNKLNFGEQPDSVVLSEVEGQGGSAQIVYRNGGTVCMQELETLCARVGWPSRPVDKVKGALENSFLVCSLTLERSPEGKGAAAPERTLIGLARATSDHAFNATIWDVLIDPDYQGQGLGKALVEQMVRHLLRQGISNITLFADAKVVDFYRKLGFEADPEGIKGMFWYPRM